MLRTLSSSWTTSTSRSIAARSRPSATITASRSGWGTLTFAFARAPRPRRTVSRASAIPSSTSSPPAPPPARAAPGAGDASARGELAQVHALERPVEVVVDLVGDERAQRREHLRDREQAVAQRRERGRLAGPEAPPRAPHGPVRE